jgi:tRNA(Ile)-lysidine synthase
MNLPERFQQFIHEHQLFTTGDQLLLAVSGGIDSVVLCELCKQAGYQFAIAHCNFKLRGEESERDAAFVQQLAMGYEVPFFIKEFDTKEYATANKLSIQEAARELRYEWFGELVKRETLNVKRQSPNGEATGHPPLATSHSLLATAHHLDDNIETMLMHFFRGTGIQGLRGMLPKQGTTVRPLLFARKQELRYFAQEHTLTWVDDSSNAQDKYTRNYFRNQVIPLVHTIYPEAENNLADNLRRFADMELLYDQAMELHRKKLCEKRGDEVHIPVLKLQKSVPLHTITWEIIKDFGFSPAQTNEVLHLLSSESGRYVQSSSHRIIRNRRWLIIAPLQSEQAQTLVIDEDEQKIVFDNMQLVLEQYEIDQAKAPGKQLPNNQSVATLDKSALHFPLLLRKWKKGDYFYPLGMKKKKKLARFFIDQKLSLTDKEKVWVLESNKKIVWVVGLRIDERFKITDATKSVLRITCQ